MTRKRIIGTLHDEKFRHRGDEILRVEALSDAVFAFSVSLLVASLEVPQTFEELKVILKGAVPFFATVALLFLLWYQQNIFFRHYGINDFSTVVLNLAYLAVILFYVYPLKFLFSLLIASWTGIELFPKAAEKHIPVLITADFAALVMLFSAGYFVIWLLLFLMHQRALHFKKELELNKYELEYTRKEKRGALWNAAVGVASFLFAAVGIEWLSGTCFLLIPVLLIVNQWMFNKKIKRL